MSFIRDFASQQPRTIAWEVLAVLAIVLVATLATFAFNGAGAGVGFDGRFEVPELKLPF